MSHGVTRRTRAGGDALRISAANWDADACRWCGLLFNALWMMAFRPPVMVSAQEEGLP